MKNVLANSTAMAIVLGAFALATPAVAASNQQAFSCDRPWSSVDGNSDGFVSKSEASSALESQFGAIDSDGNGEITKTEWVDCKMKSANLTAAPAQRDAETFHQVDNDQDSSISSEEFRDASQKAYESSRMTTGSVGSTSSTATQNDQASTQSSTSQSGQMDTSQSGQMDTSQTGQTGTSQTGQTDTSQSGQMDTSQQGQSSTSQQASTDSDNFLVLRRFIWLTPQEANDQSALSDMSADEASGRSATVFSSMDANGDGKISMEEWSAPEPASKSSQANADKEFSGLDSDGNGSISKQEFTTANSNRADMKAGTPSGQSSSSTATTSQGSSSSDQAGVPVYIYRFSRFSTM